mmetsp:Transcript_75477/g.196633  ORF Transcript_75477/g.196633 Transcript_75477/m.196633 type:complete len:118 (+) Transcript_75477:202-555(+)
MPHPASGPVRLKTMSRRRPAQLGSQRRLLEEKTMGAELGKEGVNTVPTRWSAKGAQKSSAKLDMVAARAAKKGAQSRALLRESQAPTAVDAEISCPAEKSTLTNPRYWAGSSPLTPV